MLQFGVSVKKIHNIHISFSLLLTYIIFLGAGMSLGLLGVFSPSVFTIRFVLLVISSKL